MKLLSSLFRRARIDGDMDAELRAHIQSRADDLERSGLPRAEAVRRARIEFGGYEKFKEECRDAVSAHFFETLFQDMRFALRTLRKSPGFTAVAVLTLALGIGANTALFSIINGVLLKPLPYPHPEQLFTLHESKPNFPTGSISYPNFRDWQKNNRTFSAMAIARGYNFSFTGKGEAERVRAEFITSDFFSILGIKPLLGRAFGPGEDEIGAAAPLAIVSEGFWREKLGAAPGILGKSLVLDGKSYTVVGVIPAKFDVTTGSFRAAQIYVPFGQWGNPWLIHRSAGLGIHGIGRLKPGVTLTQAQADMAAVTSALTAAYPADDKGIGASVIPMGESIVGRQVRFFLIVLLAAVGFVLLIACVNVANLLLARSTARAREFAIRAALGAGTGRLVRQLLTESVLLAIFGGALGVLLASWGTQGALALLPSALPRATEVSLDARVLLYTTAISLLAGILFGLAPALKIARPDLQNHLKEGGRGASASRQRTQSVFVLIEVAMTMVLLVGAGLMIRSLSALWNVNPGFRPDNVLTFGLSLPPSLLHANPDTIRAAFRQTEDAMKTVPGVQAVSFSWGAFPMSGDDEFLFWFAGRPKPTTTSDMNWALSYVVDPDYLRVMGIPLKSGRFFTAADDEHAPTVAVIDDVFAHKFFGNRSPIGQRLRTTQSDNSEVEIIGVVGHVNQWGLDSDNTNSLRAQAYTPYMQLPEDSFAVAVSGTSVAVRYSGAAAPVYDAIHHALQRMNSENIVYGAGTMNEVISNSLAARRFSMQILGFFAALALLLSSVGIYGVVSYLVGRRSHEIGIRLALGAQRSDILRLILGHGARMAVAGIAIGLVAAFGLTRLMAGMLFGVGATDPVTFIGVSVLLIAVALAACYIPARRAMRVDPIVALRYE
ncbi:MAG TPA: ABC transporter permease [Candidatus Acidoferrales bacterium]|nr:ABC transporter permease [Candidatus Acidoferrales bacterium]